MYYIQMKSRFGLETVDETENYQNAKYLLGEYRLSDRSSEYYISQRACKEWRKK